MQLSVGSPAAMANMCFTASRDMRLTSWRTVVIGTGETVAKITSS